MLFPSFIKQDATIKHQGVEHICIINVSTMRECGQLHVSASLPSRLGRFLNPRTGLGPAERRKSVPGIDPWTFFTITVMNFKFQDVCLFERRFQYRRGHAVASEGRSSFTDNPSGCTMGLGSSQPLTEMSTRNISWRVKAAGA